MHQLFTKLWAVAKLLQDLRDASIVTIYKNKGDKRDCNNYLGMSLLSVAEKFLAKIILRCLVSSITDNILPEIQCSFWSGCSTVDIIFSLRQLQEKCIEQQRSLYITFVDLTKAFDTTGRDGLWKLLLNLVALFAWPTSSISFMKAWKAASTYVMSCQTNVLSTAVKNRVVLWHLNSGVFLQIRTEDGLLQPCKIESKKESQGHCSKWGYSLLMTVHWLPYSLEDIHEITIHFAIAAKDFELTINLKKT